ncbi:BON domain-containing protein [uncultured Pseudodesulfovibrio sp.]|uniref:BON domain-containing protein n=1 Tax=uncultured Pseudodesulfovibrio sp. TaxID=2035858 RepID=UPI0029C7E923|nr:BON domain-containing protein [uncultured Pseudodesulfovibrio sp.]
MGKKVTHILLALLITSSAGCAVYPAVQIAGGAMTGYDAAMLADEYIPREHVEGGGLSVNQDKMLQRRLRERLELNGMTVSAHVIDAKAYLIGQIADRSRADYAIKTASTVQGIKTITCKFYPPTTRREARKDQRIHAELSEQLQKTLRLRGADLRVEVIRSQAIIIGKAQNYSQKTAAVAIASEIGDITQVIDYIAVDAPTAEGDEVASN